MKNLLTTPLVLLALLAPLNASADFAKGSAAYEAEDYATALQEFKKDAEQGDARAQSKLGVMYRNGRVVVQDDKEAMKKVKDHSPPSSNNLKSCSLISL